MRQTPLFVLIFLGSLNQVAVLVTSSNITITKTVTVFAQQTSSLSISKLSKRASSSCFNCATQKCGNYGTCGGSICNCPTGFGDVDCNTPLCGSSNDDNSKRPLLQAGSTCQCTTGFTGVNCNICQQASACIIASSSEVPLCNTSPKVCQSGSIQCTVNENILKAVYPDTTLATLDRNPKDSTSLAAVWYKSAEQFSCQMTSCQQYLNNGLYSWSCKALSCSCVPNSAFCGGPGTRFDLTGPITAASGTFLLTCLAREDGSATGSCTATFSFLNFLFPKGLPLYTCTFGECAVPSSCPNLVDVGVKGLSSSELGGVVTASLIIAAAMAGYLWSFCAYLGAKKRPVPLPQEGVTVSFQNVGYRLKRHKKPIIDGVSGMIKPGHVLAIMGPSGAGKSTFLDILAGKSKSGIVTGSVLFDNIPMSPQLQRNLIGFVDQEDTLMPTLTVRETLMFSAQLRLPESISKEDKIKKVNEVMATLGLSHVANTRVGGHGKRGISGGEKRRVSIGVELVTSPSVIVLDEPTSGLDSFNAIHVIKTLSDLARKLRKTVIFTIHQPRSDAYALFDQVLVLAKGKTLYFGPGSSAGMFFKQRGSACPEGYNMADHLLDMASVDSLAVDRFSTDSLPVIPLRQSDSIVEDDGTQIEEFEKDHMERRISTVSLIIDSLVPVEKPKRRQVGFYTQVKILSGRAFKNLIRTPSLLLAHIIIAVALGAFVGGLYYQSGTTLGGIQNRLGSIIFILALLGFSGLSAIGSFAVEKQLFLRERGNGFYGPMAYFLTKVIFDIVPLRLLPAVAMGTIAYKLIGFTDGGDHFAKYISMLIFFSAEIGLLCLTFAITISDIGTATLLGSIIILFKMLFAGFLINQSSIPPALSWIQYLSFFRYAYEAMIVNDLTDVQIHDNVSGSNITIPVSVVLDKFGFDVNAYWRDFIVSVGLLIGLLVLNAAFVQFRLKETR